MIVSVTPVPLNDHLVSCLFIMNANEFSLAKRRGIKPPKGDYDAGRFFAIMMRLLPAPDRVRLLQESLAEAMEGGEG